jgi:hypothetical protein
MKRQTDNLSFLFWKNLASAEQNNSTLWTKDHTFFSNYFLIIWPSSSTQTRTTIELAAGFVLAAQRTLVDVLFSQAIKSKTVL